MKLLGEGDFLRAWGGISSLQLVLSVVWTGMVARDVSMEFLAKWLSGAPARLAGLHRSKGAIAVGCDGDFAIWDPDAITTATATALQHRHALTPYDGARLRGQVTTTILRGNVVFAEGELRGRPMGQLISRASFRHMRRFKDLQ
jgi:allantoinase